MRHELSAEERDFIRHALGLNYQKIGYRNFYMAGGSDVLIGRSLVAKGFAREFPPKPQLRPDPTFAITRSGFEAAKLPGETMDREETARMQQMEAPMFEPMALLERVEKANGPDRDLERALYEHFCSHATQEFSEWDARHDFTHSIDTAVALMAKELPDREWAAGDDRENRRCWALVDDDVWDEAMNRHEGFAKTVPLAIIAAMLRALIAEQETKVAIDAG